MNPSWLHTAIGWLLAGRRARSRFGAFGELLESGGEPVPLVLLAMRGDGLPRILERIARACESEHAARRVDALLGDIDWRRQLVGALALILDAGRRFDSTPLWSAIDAGSWVTPQLVATAFLVDPGFAQRLKTRLEARCPVAVPQGRLSAPERHRATGPASPEERSAKLCASLLRIGARVPALGDWLAAAAARPQLAALKARDRDNSGNIAENWLNNVVAQFKSAGRPLATAAAR